MLRVKTKIGKSAIHGTGLFADEFIPKGTLTWQYDPEFDPSFEISEVENAPQLIKDFINYYSFLHPVLKKHVLPVDYLKFINHSEDESKRNIISTPDTDVASRDIQSGEELLCNYNGFDSEYFKRMKIDILK